VGKVDQHELKLEELADRTRVPPRTIRLYITRGLVPGPRRAGPNAAYGAEHVKILETIKRLQLAGMTLAQIRPELAGRAKIKTLPEPATWLSYALTEDVVVMVRGGVSSWRLRQINEAMARFKFQISEENKGGDNDQHAND
jgi:DNA-binding transcriptional MerR regulator